MVTSTVTGQRTILQETDHEVRESAQNLEFRARLLEASRVAARKLFADIPAPEQLTSSSLAMESPAAPLESPICIP